MAVGFLILAGIIAGAPELRAQTAAPAATSSSPTIENSVVRVFSTLRTPDLSKPWTKQTPREVTGSGVVIDGQRILTNAHVVQYASQVQIQANQAGDKISATVEAIAPGIDLAVLKLSDPAFFTTHPALALGNSLPGVKDTVLVYGYPTGGTSLSITKGIVSRIDFVAYGFPTKGLRVQIDAAINPGNSGGPALVGDTVIGLAFSTLANAQNIGYIIPAEEIALFLQDIADGHYDGKPTMFDTMQTLENAALRAYLKLDKSVEGVVIHQVDSIDPAYPLKKWDVITRIGDTPIDDQGMVRLDGNVRVSFGYLIQKLVKNNQVPLTIVRGGREQRVTLPVSAARPMVIPDLQGSYPSYFICGPVVFLAANAQLAAGYSSSAPLMSALSVIGSPILTRRFDRPAFEGEELVAVNSPFFPHDLAKGYGNPAGNVIESINGIPIRNLRHLTEVLRDAKEEFIVIEFAGRSGEAVVFPRKEFIASTDEILTDNGVRAQGSPDTLEIWNAKPSK